jgi:hypothetical protein
MEGQQLQLKRYSVFKPLSIKTNETIFEAKDPQPTTSDAHSVCSVTPTYTYRGICARGFLILQNVTYR